MEDIESASVDLVVTSPPYPMIEMWDGIFSEQNESIEHAIAKGDGPAAFELMHLYLDPVWNEAYRVLKPGRFACINIGDATRTLGGNFALYPNHMRILSATLKAGFTALPCVLWRKQTNAPNKFMGSGTLPAGAYVTLEHEYILILRKGSKREFKRESEKSLRRESAMFWEERNAWFSDVWFDVKGALQALNGKKGRSRSGAFPFELAYRLINMYSAKEDVVLDPFLGTGTTTIAAMVSARNSIGYEIDSTLKNSIYDSMDRMIVSSNEYISKRIANHLSFVDERLKQEKIIKHKNKHYGFPVITSQERELLLNDLILLEETDKGAFITEYSTKPQECYVLNEPHPEPSDYRLPKMIKRAQPVVSRLNSRPSIKQQIPLF